MSEQVSRGVCDAQMNDVQRQLDTAERRLNEHSKELKDQSKAIQELTAISVKLTQLIEQNTEDQDRRLAALEVKPEPWYQQEIGKFCIKSFVLLVLILTAGAIGSNFFEAWNTIKPM